jgi:glutamate synthase (ferredoxin)
MDHWKARHLDLSRILAQPDVPASYGRSCTVAQEHGVEASLDATTLLGLCAPALSEGLPVRASLPIRNVNRVVGTMVGSEVTRRWGAAGLPDDTIRLAFTGSAGQSLGAFIPPGVTLVLDGDANDYVGKGLSGGRIVVRPPAEATFVAHENVIVGNVVLYGATAGETFIRGVAGERFAVRNSGAVAVVEGVGDHGCEYMTGGRVLVLGRTGRNFAAGMSGGIAWVWDEDGTFAARCNTEMVALEPLADEVAEVVALLERHRDLTGSQRAAAILAGGVDALRRFVRVVPHDYRRVVDAQARMRAAGLPDDEAEMAAFEENTRDLARVGGS